jgi:hypothetical protein
MVFLVYVVTKWRLWQHTPKSMTGQALGFPEKLPKHGAVRYMTNITVAVMHEPPGCPCAGPKPVKRAVFLFATRNNRDRVFLAMEFADPRKGEPPDDFSADDSC